MPEHLLADIPQKAFIVHEGKILLTKEPDGSWQPPGGRLDVGEQPRDALQREMREELGIEVEVKGMHDAFVFTSKSGVAHFVVMYICTLKNSPEEIVLNPKEVEEIRWFGAGEFEELKLREGYKEALRKYFHAT